MSVTVSPFLYINEIMSTNCIVRSSCSTHFLKLNRIGIALVGMSAKGSWLNYHSIRTIDFQNCPKCLPILAPTSYGIVWRLTHQYWHSYIRFTGRSYMECARQLCCGRLESRFGFFQTNGTSTSYVYRKQTSILIDISLTRVSQSM